MADPQQPVRHWHVGPLVDVIAYHFSWLLILVPLLLSGDKHPADYLALWAIGITTSFVHRHVTMPYVYLDEAVLHTHLPRFTVVPVFLFCGFVASAALQKTTSPASFFTTLDIAALLAVFALPTIVWWRDRHALALTTKQLVASVVPVCVAVVLGMVAGVKHHTVVVAVVLALALSTSLLFGKRTAAFVGAVVVVGLAGHFGVGALHDKPVAMNAVVGVAAIVAALWNIWHTPAQKVGILRVYNAKSDAPVAQKVPLWVDRWLVLGWFPFLAAFLVARERDVILTQGRVVKMWLEPIVDGVSAAAPVLLPIGVITGLASVANFVWWEWKSSRCRNVPRLSMAAGLTLLSASFLFASPLKVYVAYGFSHAVEYVVFVWAFQRKRYAVPLSPMPTLQKVLRHSGLFYGCFVGGISAFYVYSEFGRRFGWYDEPVRIGGVTLGTIIYAWAIWHSFAHFYFDGFLWKMRLPTVRASL